MGDLDLDVLDSTVHYKDARGFDYVGISEAWKRMCLDLPCSKRVQIPLLYKQQSLATTIDGQPVVIQAWKGNCPQAYRELPGGIGGEVGIYRVIEGKRIPDELALPRIAEFPLILRPVVRAVVSRILKELVAAAEHGVPWWWPFPELDAKIEMKLVHPDDGGELFTADPAEPAGGYWMSRWMSYDSYARFTRHEEAHGRAMPAQPYDWAMELSVKGHRFRWDAHAGPIRPL